MVPRSNRSLPVRSNCSDPDTFMRKILPVGYDKQKKSCLRFAAQAQGCILCLDNTLAELGKILSANGLDQTLFGRSKLEAALLRRHKGRVQQFFAKHGIDNG